MYKDLLLSEGGGINVRMAQDDKNDIPALIIGLGGTGGDTIKKIKKEVFKQIKPDRMEEDVPVYDSIRFLVVDSDDSEAYLNGGRIGDIDVRTEFFDISCRNWPAILPHLNKKEFAWFNSKEINSGQVAYGAGGIRQVGRLLFMLKAQDFYNRIQDEIRTLLQNNNADEINIHICTGMSGGTGGGIFLDVCYLIQVIMESCFNQTEYRSDYRYRFFGYFFLPDVNLQQPGIRGNALWEDALKRNGYCAMKELDYCMNFEYNRDRFRMDYGFTNVDTGRKPVDFCHLISSGQNPKTDPYGYVINCVAEHMVVDQLMDYFREENHGYVKKINYLYGLLFAHYSFCSQKSGAMPHYMSFGISAMEIPHTELATYLGAKLFEKFHEYPVKTPSGKDVDEFLGKIGFNRILNDFSQNDTHGLVIPMALDLETYKEFGEMPFVGYADEFLDKKKKALEEKYCGLAEGIIDYNDTTWFSSSLVQRTFRVLCDCCLKEPGYGYEFVCALISGRYNRNLLQEVNGYIEKSEMELEKETKITDTISCDLEQARNQLKNKPGKVNFKNWIKQLECYYDHLERLESCRKMKELLGNYREQLDELEKKYFAVFDETVRELYATFQQNLVELSKEEDEDWRVKSQCCSSLININNIKQYVDEKLLEYNTDLVWKYFVDLMIRESQTWLTKNERKICGIVSEFISDYFRSTIMACRMGTECREKRDRMHKVIDEELIPRAEMLFVKDELYWEEDYKISILTYPYYLDSIGRAVSESKLCPYVISVGSALEDRLVYTELNSIIPLFAYQPLAEYEKTYEEYGKSAGCHLFESEELDWRTWLPSPIPYSYSCYQNDSESFRQKNQKLIEEFKEAEEAGVIIRDFKEDRWYILVLRDDVADKGFTPAEDGTGKEQKEEDPEALDRMLQERERMEIRTGRIADGYEEIVVQDLYLRSPVMQGIVQCELKKMEKINRRKVKI